MLRNILVRIVFGLLCVSMPVAGFANDDTITWMEADFPPFLIHEGEFAGEGYGDTGTDIIIENLPQYKHQQIIANLSRQYKLFKQQDNVCTVGLYKNPEREKFMYFSIPVVFSLPNLLIINKEKYQDFGGKRVVSLTEVLKSNKLIIGHSNNRSYGSEIDSIIKKNGTGKNLFLYEGRELALNFFEMLKRDRLDAIIGSPEEVLFQAERLGIRDQLMTITIEETQESLEGWFSYVVCSKTPWGKQAVEDVNKVLIEQRPTDRYRATYERWLDASGIEGFRKSYKEIFLPVIQ